MCQCEYFISITILSHFHEYNIQIHCRHFSACHSVNWAAFNNSCNLANFNLPKFTTTRTHSHWVRVFFWGFWARLCDSIRMKYGIVSRRIQVSNEYTKNNEVNKVKVASNASRFELQLCRQNDVTVTINIDISHRKRCSYSGREHSQNMNVANIRNILALVLCITLVL